MPEPQPKDEEQYGPPLPPKEATRQWRIPSTGETMLRDMGMSGAADTAADFQRGTVQVPEWLKRLDPLQGARDLTGWELPTSDEVQQRTPVEIDLRKRRRALDQREGKWGGLPPALESLPGDMLSMLRLNPIFPEEYMRPGSDPLQDMANTYNRTRQQAPPRQGTTTVERPGREEPEAPIEWNGTVGVTR